jgi:hypothetical protein
MNQQQYNEIAKFLTSGYKTAGSPLVESEDNQAAAIDFYRNVQSFKDFLQVRWRIAMGTDPLFREMAEQFVLVGLPIISVIGGSTNPTIPRWNIAIMPQWIWEDFEILLNGYAEKVQEKFVHDLIIPHELKMAREAAASGRRVGLKLHAPPSLMEDFWRW